MKMISSFMDDLLIKKGKYHTVTFESSYIQDQFRRTFQAYSQEESLPESEYLHILNDNGQEVQSKIFHFISFDCNVVHLQKEKSTTRLLQDLLHFHLENHPDMVREYLKLNKHINEFTSHLEIPNDNLIIDIEPSEKTISQFIKSLNISLEYNNSEYIPNYILRKFLIQSMLRMNLNEKDVFLVISFPETDIGNSDYEKFIEILKGLQVTTLIITNQLDFLTAAEKEDMFLVDKKGDIYDIVKLYQELQAFELVEQNDTNKIAETLAFRVFKQDYLLMDKEFRRFLKSNEL